MKLLLFTALSIVTLASNAMDIAEGDTKLHTLAKQGEYKQCLAVLTEAPWLTEDHIKVATYDEAAYKALKIHRSHNKSTEKPSMTHEEAMQRIAPFLLLSQKYYMHQLALADVMRTTLNHKLETPFDCAEQANVPKELLLLLNPREQALDMAIMRMVYQKLGGADKEGIVIMVPGSQKESPSK